MQHCIEDGIIEMVKMGCHEKEILEYFDKKKEDMCQNRISEEKKTLPFAKRLKIEIPDDAEVKEQQLSTGGATSIEPQSKQNHSLVLPSQFSSMHLLMSAAIEHNHFNLAAEILKDKQFDINPLSTRAVKLQCNFHLSPLHFSCYLGYKSFIKLFADHGANVHLSCLIPKDFLLKETISNIQNGNSWMDLIDDSFRLETCSAFELVLIHDSVDLMLPLAEKFQSDDDIDRKRDGLKPRYCRGQTALYVACEEGAFDCVRYLLEKNPADVNANYLWKTPFDLVLDKGAKFIKLLLDYGATASENSLSHLLQLYCKPETYLPCDIVSTVQLLIQQKTVNINFKFRGPYYAPIPALLSHIWKELHSGWEDTSTPYTQETHQQLIKSCVLLLIKDGADVGQVSSSSTPEVQPLCLLMDIFKGAVRSMLALFRNTNSQIQRAKDNTRIQKCMEFILELIDIMLKAGANPDVANTWRMLPLNQCYFLISDIWLHLIPGLRPCLFDFIQRCIVLLLGYGATHSFNMCMFYQSSIVLSTGVQAMDIAEELMNYIDLYLNSLSHAQRLGTLKSLKTHIPQYQSTVKINENISQDRSLKVCDHMLDIVCAKLQEPCSLKHCARISIIQSVKRKILPVKCKLKLPFILVEYLTSFSN